ncbi:cysteine--tRNA ligase [Candidatus Gracilibacteria bacterium]|nr:cysteine--tRNA ligase [Candidatus Gracilibacteria bacterium]MCF7819038.1 cysteine--tRNA ligase [Candidatus Gracilibacteria bacterium]
MIPDIFLHNTLSGKKEKFQPIQLGQVKIYSCGPTVYDYAHIGNFRSFIMADILVRVFQYAGYEVIKAQNITDVGHLTQDDTADSAGEDKIARKAAQEKLDPFAIARRYEEAFIEDEKSLRILPPQYRPRATDYILEQIQLAQDLIAAGYAYEVNGSVYFRTKKYESYGQLSKNKLEDLVAGARVEINSEKEDPLDFALWKKADTSHLMQWESPWGRGFPGWHAECSAMSTKLLGLPFDIHTGGEDNIFPHHECEIAQNECSHGGQKSVNYWLHVKHLQVEGKKMSKSKGNFYTIRDLLSQGWKGNEIRYVLLSGHYRTSLNFTMDSLQMARSSIERLSEAVRIFREEANGTPPDEFARGVRERFREALFDDLNMADGLSVAFDLVKTGMKLREEKKLSSASAASIVQFLEEDFEDVIAVLPGKEVSFSPEERAQIEKKIQERNQAREEKDWARADQIRDELAARGIELIDEEGKTIWKKQ